jgi:hypothetical protein
MLNVLGQRTRTLERFEREGCEWVELPHASLRLSAWAMTNDELAHAASYTADFGSAASPPWYANNSDNAVALAPGFQHGRCFYCNQPLGDLGPDVHVDHVFPFRRMNTGSWRGPSLLAQPCPKLCALTWGLWQGRSL